MNPYENFYLKRATGLVEGPFDLVQMGTLLQEKTITSETLVRVEGSLDWQPFGGLPQFAVIKETAVDMATRFDQMEKMAESDPSVVPLLSRENLRNGIVTFAIKAFILMAAAVVAYLIPLFDHKAGTAVILVGVAVAAIAQCLILGKVLSEDFFTIGKVSLVPLYDIYYFGSNLDTYFSSFFAKYLGISMAVAAAAGMHASQGGA